MTSVKPLNDKFITGVIEGFYGKPWLPEQRFRLFRRMNDLGLNTYIYAPKDDSKHRMYWRDLYTVEEAELLTSLIQVADENNVSFVYALSPGLDIIYSSAKEVSCMKRKLEQVASFGCKAFALLFDDIEIELSDADRSHYQSFAAAQVSVTNEVYQHLEQPKKFFFCPTEYCASRAVPSVEQSEYLNTLGSKLCAGIDIMWTGQKVISKKITIKSIEEITKVLQRPPLIWDNLHANDYDPRRLFLGPYEGRSSELIPYLHGVLSNPNCEFDLNFIPFHTFAQWSKSNAEGHKKDVISGSSPVTADIELETDGEYNADEDTPANSIVKYVPKKALKNAINDWLAEFSETSRAPKKVVAPVELPAAVSNAIYTEVLPPPTAEPEEMKSSSINCDGTDVTSPPVLLPPAITTLPVHNLLENSSSESDADEENAAEPMDCIPTPSAISQPPESVQNDDEQKTDNAGETMQVDSEEEDVTYEDISKLVDLFYMPFEYGSYATIMLSEFYWLKSNAFVLRDAIADDATQAQKDVRDTWYERSDDFLEMINSTSHLLDKLCQLPNKALSFQLFPYLWDMKNVLGLLTAFVLWLKLHFSTSVGSNWFHQRSFAWSNNAYKDQFASGDAEPWFFRGGVQGEFQRMLPFETASDMLFFTCPLLPDMVMFNIRPYSATDKATVYEVCRQTFSEYDGVSDDSDLTTLSSYPDLIPDNLIGAFLEHSAEYCFVVEDSLGVCGYVLSALNARVFYSKVEAEFLPAMRIKYPKTEQTENISPAQKLIDSFYCCPTAVPDSILSRYPSILRVNMIQSRMRDSNAARRAVACAIAVLRVMGSYGIFTQLHVNGAATNDFYRRQGFYDIPVQEPLENIVFMGRII